MHAILKNDDFMLRVDVEKFDGSKAYAEYGWGSSIIEQNLFAGY